MIPLILEQAILATHKATPIKQLDFMAHYANLNLAVNCFQETGGKLIDIKGELKSIEKKHSIYQRPVFKYSVEDGYHHVTVSTIIFNVPFTEGMYKYHRQSLGAHNDTKNIDYYFEKKTGNLILPFELVSLARVNSIPENVGIKSAFSQNPFHPCFFHRLVPAPVAGVAVNSNLDSMMGFVVHHKLLLKVLEANIAKENELSLQYDTKIALNLLNLRYGIYVNEKVISALEKLDEDLIKVNGTTFLDIEGDW